MQELDVAQFLPAPAPHELAQDARTHEEFVVAQVAGKPFGKTNHLVRDAPAPMVGSDQQSDYGRCSSSGGIMIERGSTEDSIVLDSDEPDRQAPAVTA